MQRVAPCAPGGVVACARCGSHLSRPKGAALDRVLPLTVAAAILFLIANASPVVAIEAAGTHVSASVADTIVSLWSGGMPLVAVLVAVTTLIVPVAELAVLGYLLFTLRFGDPQPGRRAEVLRLAGHLRPWAMVEVFLLGVLVSLVKLAAIASVTPGIGLWALAGFIVLTAAAHSSFDGQDYWSRLEPAG